MKSWVLPEPFLHRGNAHPVACGRQKLRKVVIWILVVVIAQPVLCHSVLAYGVALHSLEY
jgi:Ni/Fe-hydrogenase subunit HybB-like protein